MPHGRPGVGTLGTLGLTKALVVEVRRSTILEAHAQSLGVLGLQLGRVLRDAGALTLRGMAIHVGYEVNGVLQSYTVWRGLKRRLDRGLRGFCLGLDLADGQGTTDVGLLLVLAGKLAAAGHIRGA